MNAMHYISDFIRLPHISDPFIFIPKCYFNNNGWDGVLNNSDKLLFHQAVVELLRTGLSIKSIEFISDRTYPTNTIQIGNPYFQLISRPEANILFEENCTFRYNHEKIEFYSV